MTYSEVIEKKVTACEKILTAKKNEAAAARKLAYQKDAAVKEAEAKLASAKQEAEKAAKMAASVAAKKKANPTQKK